MLNREYKFNIFALMYPFKNSSLISKYIRKLGMDFFKAHCNGKNCFFLKEGYQEDVQWIYPNKLLQCLMILILNKASYIAAVYAKCDRLYILHLWEDIYRLSNSYNFPWITCGDFNVVLNAKEKIDGVLCNQVIQKYLQIVFDFAQS